MGDFKLSACLQEHEDDVRDVCYPDPTFILTASRDATVRLWKPFENQQPARRYDGTVAVHGQSFINAVTYWPKSPEFPDGLIISGGKDTIIDVRPPGKTPDVNAEALLIGHAHNVCTLDVSVEAGIIVSGSWDGTARVWKVGSWECAAVLEGHEGSVWSVLAYDAQTIITGCADKAIRIFHPQGKLYRKIDGGSDVVRALCRLSKGDSSEAAFASAGNDSIIRIWTLAGAQVAELHGHESFVYSLAALPSGELVSSGEDRTVRIWRDHTCIQTITHPAISVWSVAVCCENGDIVSGASDRIARVFTRDKARYAEPDVIRTFEDSVKASSIPQQQVGSIKKETLPGPDFLIQKSGTKEGQVQMIREQDGSVSAHQWSQSSHTWTNVGTVVDAVGSSGKKTTYAGKDYDYVFDVDIEDGKPPLKLPFNLSQNPYEAATTFIQNNELPATYLDQVANFIMTNTQGATLGQQPEPAGADPWGTGARYRPGDASAAQAPPAISSTRPKVLPQTHYLSIKTANVRTILQKILEFNTTLIKDGANDITMNTEQVKILEAAGSHLETSLNSAKSDTKPLSSCVPIVYQILANWPAQFRLPVLDLSRLLTAVSPDMSTHADPDLATLLGTAGFEDTDRSNNIMLSIRAFGNLFSLSEGIALADQQFDHIHFLTTAHTVSSNRNTAIAAATLSLNYAVLFTSSTYKDLPSSIDRGLSLVNDLTLAIKSGVDSEAVYRSLVAMGTLLSLGEEIQTAAKDIYDLKAALSKAESRLKEPRIKSVIGEIRERLMVA